MRIQLALLLPLGVIPVTSSIATAAQEAPDTRIEQPLVSSTIIIDGKIQSSDVVPADQSGLTVDAVEEDDAEQIRRDAEEALARNRLPTNLPISQPKVTVVSADEVVVERPNARDSEACVTIGKIASRKGCRPIRK